MVAPRVMELDGVPLVHVPGDGRTSLRVLFRTGVADERLRQRGWTHLLEHLVLADDSSFDHTVNGGVGLHHTEFVFRGAPAEAATWLRRLGERLSEPPLARLALEKRVLDAEASGRGTTLVEHLLQLRYGSRGPGVVASPELGLTDVPPLELKAFAAARFVRAACVVLVDGALPGDLALPLPDGRPRPVPAAVPLPLQLPASLDLDGAGPAWSGTAPQGAAARVFAAVLEERAFRLLRHKHAVAYSPSVSWVAVDAEQVHLGLVLDSSSERRELAGRLLPQLIAALADAGPTAEELTRALETRSRAQAERGAAGDGHALAERLLRDEPEHDDAAEVTADDVRSVARTAYASSLWLLPGAALGQVDARQLPRWSTDKVDGRSFAQRRQVSPRNRPSSSRRLVVGEDGVMVDGGPADRLTVRWHDVVLSVVYTDGARALHGVDGTQLLLQPSQWRGAHDLPDCVDARVDASHVIRLSTRGDPDAAPKRRMSTAMRVTMSAGAVLAIVLLSTLSVIGWLLATVVLVMLYGNYDHHRRGAP